DDIRANMTNFEFVSVSVATRGGTWRGITRPVYPLGRPIICLLACPHSGAAGAPPPSRGADASRRLPPPHPPPPAAAPPAAPPAPPERLPGSAPRCGAPRPPGHRRR